MVNNVFKKIALLLIFLLLLRSAASALEIMLPQVYEEGINISNWLMSEKLDGVRGLWDGEQMLSKNGIPLHPSAAFLKNFPGFKIEGEIWGGRNNFEKTVSIVKKQADNEGWLELRFAIFDVPDAKGGFEDRLRVAEEWFAAHPSKYAFVIEHLPVEDNKHLDKELDRVESLGGEGIILRRPGSPYRAGRSADVLKVKSYADMEATVISHIHGNGRNKGRMGSLLVRLPGSLISFKIGTGFSDKERENPPPVGSLITFKYYGFYESGIPKFPSFLRIREDL